MTKDNTTRSTILTAARQLIYYKGYLDTSISDIMRTANVGKGQLYYYFDTKKSIGLAVLQQLDHEWRDELIIDILDERQPADISINRMFKWLLDFHYTQPAFYGCPIGNEIVEMSSKDEDFRLLLANLINTWISALDIKVQQLDHETPISAETIIDTLQGAIMLTKLDQSVKPLESAVINLQKALKINLFS